MAKTIFDMFRSGELQELENKKILIPSIIPLCKVYAMYLSFKNDGYSYEEAIEETMELCCVSRRTVQRAINRVPK